MELNGAAPGVPPAPAERDGTKLVRNSLWTIASGAVPLVALLISVPIFRKKYGPEGLGAMNLCWAALAYFIVLDFGLGRSVTKVVAGRRASADPRGIGEAVWTALALAAIPGLCASAVALAVDIPALLGRWGLDPETVRHVGDVIPQTFLAALPIVGISVLRGMLEAFERFDLAGVSRFLSALATFVVPLLAATAGASLEGALRAVTFGQWGVLLAVAGLARGIAPPGTGGPRVSGATCRELLSQGGWLAVSATIGPIMVYFDRFILAARVPLGDVAAYAVPQEIITKSVYLAGAVGVVVYPWSSRLSSEGKALDGPMLRGTALAVAFAFPGIVGVAGFSPEILAVLMGPEMSGPAAAVMRVLSLGVFANAAAQVAANVIQGVGRPDVMARLHLIEIPIYLGVLCVTVPRWGLMGAAWTWTLRAAVDAGLILFQVRRLGLLTKGAGLRRLSVKLLPGLAVLAAVLLAKPWGLRAAAAAVGIPLFSWLMLREAPRRESA